MHICILIRLMNRFLSNGNKPSSDMSMSNVGLCFSAENFHEASMRIAYIYIYIYIIYIYMVKKTVVSTSELLYGHVIFWFYMSAKQVDNFTNFEP